ncbi:MAG: lactonase family protein [Acidobacteria bacterium]|nr:lactonase family protein [Acidobacteriota bacterium]
MVVSVLGATPVGCYTARGQGIYVYDVNPSTGALSPVRIVGSPTTTPNLSFLALSPNGKNLYCCNEIGNFGRAQSGSVTAFATDYATGNLTMLNSQPTQGRNPAHLSVDATGRFVIAPITRAPQRQPITLLCCRWATMGGWRRRRRS